MYVYSTCFMYISQLYLWVMYTQYLRNIHITIYKCKYLNDENIRREKDKEKETDSNKDRKSIRD